MARIPAFVFGVVISGMLPRDEKSSLISYLGLGKNISSKQKCKLLCEQYAKEKYGPYTTKQILDDAYSITVIDKFGKEVFLIPVDDEHFKVTTNVSVSPQFFAWIFGLGNYAKIVGPEEVKKQMVEMMTGTLKRYEK